jgi:hypothetical protein
MSVDSNSQYGRPSADFLIVYPLTFISDITGASCIKQAVSYLLVCVDFIGIQVLPFININNEGTPKRGSLINHAISDTSDY